MAKGPCRPKLRLSGRDGRLHPRIGPGLEAARERRRFGQCYLAAGPLRSRKRWPPKEGGMQEQVTDRQVTDRLVTPRRLRTASTRSSIRLSPPAFSYSPGRYGASRKTGTWLISSRSSPALCSFPDWRRNGADAKERRREDFDEWASGDFVTWQSRLRGWEADRPDPAADRGRGARNGGFRYSRALHLRAVTDGPLENAPAGSSARDGISPPP